MVSSFEKKKKNFSLNILMRSQMKSIRDEEKKSAES